MPRELMESFGFGFGFFTVGKLKFVYLLAAMKKGVLFCLTFLWIANRAEWTNNFNKVYEEAVNILGGQEESMNIRIYGHHPSDALLT